MARVHCFLVQAEVGKFYFPEKCNMPGPQSPQSRHVNRGRIRKSALQPRRTDNFFFLFYLYRWPGDKDDLSGEKLDNVDFTGGLHWPVYRYGHQVEDRTSAARHVHGYVKVANEVGQHPSAVHLEREKSFFQGPLPVKVDFTAAMKRSMNFAGKVRCLWLFTSFFRKNKSIFSLDVEMKEGLIYLYSCLAFKWSTAALSSPTELAHK